MEECIRWGKKGAWQEVVREVLEREGEGEV